MPALYLVHGIAWTPAGPRLRLTSPDGTPEEMPMTVGTRLGFRVLDPQVFCLGSHRVHSADDRKHVPCRLQAPAERGYQCVNCFLNDDLRFLHDSHRSGRAPEGLLLYLAQPHWLYVATFAHGASKVGTAANIRKSLRLAEQGAVAARYVAKTRDGRVVRVLEDMVSAATELTQAVRSAAKYAGLLSPLPTDELGRINAGHAAAVRELLPSAQLEGFDVVDEQWQLPELAGPVLADGIRRGYPSSFDSGDHGLTAQGILGSVATVQLTEDGPLFLADLGRLKGRRIALGEFASELPALQEQLF
ncbi:DUF2797 domain-containing protein [Arthrobacter sulfonylureivorans]|uniref:DUF2797 domain-containing protein n=1 Tax=Arthrobacter sulfonylureivorans TaxID=2486855 RepID=UPI0039E578CB